MSYNKISDYSIMIKIDGEEDYEIMSVSKYLYKYCTDYPFEELLIEHKDEYEDMMKKIQKWCDYTFKKVKEQEMKRKEEQEKKKKNKIENYMKN